MTDMPSPHESHSIQAHYGRLVSCTLACPDVSLAGFLRHAHGKPRFYWERGDDVAFAGFGAAVELMAWGPGRFDSIRASAADLFENALVLDDGEPLAAPRLFGGFSFRDDFVPDNAWADFTPAHFVLPHYQLLRSGDQTWLTINAQIPMDEDPAEIIPELQQALAYRVDLLRAAEMQEPDFTASQPPLLDIAYPMEYETWAERITAATGKMRAGSLNKAVLARVCEIRFEDRVNVDAALAFLAEAYAECYRFLFEPRPFHAFYGATPELLVRTKDEEVRTMGLASTIKRGQTPEADAELVTQLMNDGKERYEHALVVEGIRAKLEPITSALEIPDAPGILKLKNIQHLYTPIQGTLREPDGVLPLVARLHPTPALGGDPFEAAMDIIAESEPVPRGWYAAPVGWIDRDLDGEFAVAIRSAVASDKRVWLYAGAGIVAESQPQREWDETALKFRAMLDALHIGESVDV